MRHILRSSGSVRTQRGMVLAGTMLLLLGIMVILVLGMISTPKGSANNGLMFNSNNSLHMANARMNSVGAFNMAEAGVQYTLQWLNSLPGPPSNTTAFGPNFTWGTGIPAAGAAATRITPDPGDAGNTFAVTVYPDASNVQNQQKKYLIESTGTSNGVSQVIQVYITVSSLSKWLILVNQWPSGNYWVSGLTTFDGPVHDNNANGLNENVLWTTNATSPMWSYSGTDAYQLSGGVNWYKNYFNSPGTPGADGNQSEWLNVLSGGQATFTTGAAKVPFPTSSALQADAAEALPPGTPLIIPPATGVTVTPGGGIYIHSKNSENDSNGSVPSPNNDVQQLTLSTDGSGNQVITVLQNDDHGNPMTTTITLNAATQTTQVQVSQEPPKGGPPKVTTTSVPGLTNGVVYADGNIGNQGTAPGNPTNGSTKTGGLAGTIANNVYGSNGNLIHGGLTIATAANKNVNIDGNLVYATARQKNASGGYVPESQDPNFTKNAGTFGLVSNNVLITTQNASGQAMNNVEVDGAVLAYTLYEVDQYNTRPVGNWENMGGYLSANMGYFGVFSNNNNQLVNGMNTSFNYDERMRDAGPPYFPTNGNNYDVLSWRRVSATLE